MTRSLRGPSTYWSTTFPSTEQPMSQGGIWLNGSTNGLDWADVDTTPGKGFGTQSGADVGNRVYADSTAILNGAFGADQAGEGTVFVIPGPGYQAEVEIRLRSTMNPHSSTGYEVDYSCNGSGGSYLALVRWEGLEGTFTQLQLTNPGAVSSGDVVRGTITGSIINGYINGVLQASIGDTRWTSGQPGMGFFLMNQTGSAAPSGWGFSKYTAWTIYSRGLATNRVISGTRNIAS